MAFWAQNFQIHEKKISKKKSNSPYAGKRSGNEFSCIFYDGKLLSIRLQLEFQTSENNEKYLRIKK